jgi:hypothetical protein
VSAHPTTPLVAAEAIVNLDGSGTWSIDGTIEQISATTAPAAREDALRRTALAAAERGTAIELTAVLAGVPTFLRVSPTGEVTRLEGSTFTPVPAASSPETEPSSQTVTDRHVPPDGAERRPRWALAAAAGVLATAAVAGLLFLRAVGDGSPSPTPTGTPTTAASAPPASPSRSTVVPAVVRRKLDVTVTARKGGPLAAQVRATAAPTVVTVTLWRHGRIIAKRRLHLTAGRTTWASGDVTFQRTGPGRYRWAVTAPGASRVTGTYTVPVKPTPRYHRLQQPGNTGAVGVTPSPTRAAAPSAPPSPPPVTAPPSTPRPSTPPPTAGTRRPGPHNGPVPGGDTNPPHPGPSP